MMGGSLQRTWHIAHKECLHILRDPQTLFFTLFIPLAEMTLLGYAINTNVRDIQTVVVDYCQTQESRRLIEQFENSDDVEVIHRTYNEAEAQEELVAGRAQMAIVIPADYARKLDSKETATFQVLVDGTVSSIASEAVSVSNAIALRGSLSKALQDDTPSLEARPRVLFNPDASSSHYFLPGLIVIVSQLMATLLSASAIVKEKELGTLEQFVMTPVRRGEVIIGKLCPYVLLTGIEFCLLLLLMNVLFSIVVVGALSALLLLLLPFTLSMLSLGLLISTRAQTRDAAAQIGMGTIIPSIFLSGYIFPLESMSVGFQYVGNCLPTTWLIDATRGIILRGTDWQTLWLHAVVLWSMALVMMTVAAIRMRKAAV